MFHNHLKVFTNDGHLLLTAVQVTVEAVGVEAFPGSEGNELVIVADVYTIDEHGPEKCTVVGLEGVGTLKSGAFGGFQSGKAGGDVWFIRGPGFEAGFGLGLGGGGAGGAAVGGDESGVGAAHEKGVALPLEVHSGPEGFFHLVKPNRRDVAPGSYVVGVDGDG